MAKQTMQERSTWDNKRFMKTAATTFGITFGVLTLVMCVGLGLSLGMNWFIYKQPIIRIIMGVYCAIGFGIVIPYAMYRSLFGGNIPFYWTFMPVYAGRFPSPFLQKYLSWVSWNPSQYAYADTIANLYENTGRKNADGSQSVSVTPIEIFELAEGRSYEDVVATFAN